MRWQCLDIDCTDPDLVATFWQEALGWRRTLEHLEGESPEIVLEPPSGSPEDGVSPDLLFIGVDSSGDLKLGEVHRLTFRGRTFDFLPILHYSDLQAREAAREPYEGLTKVELSDRLAERGLPKTGNVDELIERLVSADSE